VYDFLIVAFTISREFPEFTADLNEDRHFRRERSVYRFGSGSDVSCRYLGIHLLSRTRKGGPNTYFSTLDINGLYLGGDDAYEGYFLVNEYTLPYKVFG
jgi:hypothetical protein